MLMLTVCLLQMALLEHYPKYKGLMDMVMKICHLQRKPFKVKSIFMEILKTMLLEALHLRITTIVKHFGQMAKITVKTTTTLNLQMEVCQWQKRRCLSKEMPTRMVNMTKKIIKFTQMMMVHKAMAAANCISQEMKICPWQIKHLIPRLMDIRAVIHITMGPLKMRVCPWQIKHYKLKPMDIRVIINTTTILEMRVCL